MKLKSLEKDVKAQLLEEKTAVAKARIKESLDQVQRAEATLERLKKSHAELLERDIESIVASCVPDCSGCSVTIQYPQARLMATVIQEQPSFVYGDGENLFIDLLGNGCVKLVRPLITAVSIEMQRDFIAVPGLDGYSRIIPSDLAPYREVNLTLRVVDAEYMHSPVPDLRSMVEKLTISELFQVINRKLDKAA